MSDALLEIRFLSYWATSGGRGQGRLHDEVTRVDPDGLPFLPGRHVRGLLRRAVECSGTYQGLTGGEWATRLFGAQTSDETLDRSPEGLLRVDDAVLVGVDREAAQSKPDCLFQTLQNTAIDRERGGAKDKSLRTMQVAIPMVLYAPLAFDDLRANRDENLKVFNQNWIGTLQNSLPLVRAWGKHRNSGLGRAVSQIHFAKGA